MFKNNNNEPIPFYRAIIDPTSFMNSVDNCFQMAFLFRDGHLFLDIDSDGLPIIKPVTKSERDSDRYKNIQQLISSLNPSLCNQMIERYAIEEPLLVINRDDLFVSHSLTQQEPIADTSSSSASQAKPSQRKKRSQR